jgi:hypothetical protein
MMETHGSLGPMLISIPTPRARELAFSFTVFRGKFNSTGNQIFKAENQAAVSAAYGLKNHPTGNLRKSYLITGQ